MIYYIRFVSLVRNNRLSLNVCDEVKKYVSLPLLSPSIH